MNAAVKENKLKPVLITGIAGFIGFHFAKKILTKHYPVIGIDNLNNYYDSNLKTNRLKQLGFSQNQIDSLENPNQHTPSIQLKTPQRFVFYKVNLKEKDALKKIFAAEKPGYVVHLAAQAGVRYSIKEPYAYIDSNIISFMNILENCRHHPVKHLVFSSSSSVYGANENMPFSVHHNVDHPISLYAATKKSNELLAHSYANLYQIPTTGLRFFTVYGPWGRPDMAYFSFTNKILNNIPIEVFNYGNMKRDFTYIDDIVAGVYQVMLKIPEGNPDWDGRNPDPASSRAPYRIFNIGNHQPIDLLYFIELIEKNLGKKAKKKLLPMQKGDVKETYADIHELQRYIGFKPVTTIEEGIKHFVTWYLDYYGIKK
ncbi:MAG: NAD-dependent epimerase/dehydratase family protein [Candidatus Aminicenantes bacterium]|nr:MAG: NAD-dependent epimerase/dehydratase family protein [Candidatus Aminicenantes bacterium]